MDEDISQIAKRFEFYENYREIVKQKFKKRKQSEQTADELFATITTVPEKKKFAQTLENETFFASRKFS